MPEILTFNRIKNGEIFEQEFNNLVAYGNSSIEFKMQNQTRGGIAVIYAPNGTGKTSFSRVLACESSDNKLNFVADYNGCQISAEDKKFHVIKDQLNRNVIPGDTSDYLIGADIRHEYELKMKIAEGFSTVFSRIPKVLKDEFLISKIGDYLLSKLENQTAIQYFRDIIPSRSRGRNINKDEFIRFISNTPQPDIPDDADEDKLKFMITDCASSRLIEKILCISLDNIIINTEIAIIEQNEDAIELLKKYSSEQICIVCDNTDFDAQQLFERKSENRKRIYENLQPATRELLDKVINDCSLRSFDPFNVKNTVTNFIKSGDIDSLHQLQEELTRYLHFVSSKILSILLKCFDGTTMLVDYSEYMALLESQPQIDSEELLYIQEIISENIGPDITIVRDDANDRNFKLMLAGQEFLGVEREKLHLSTGEQNFISLAFELLLARRTDKEFVVMDDPVSSFDSVYKNKIAFCIIKFLEDKKQIILTHNTDLVRLLDVQQNGCFNFYLFNNVSGGNNGFISVNDNEKALLINLSKLIKLFQNYQNTLVPFIKNEKQFLISMIPFMRGYAHICKDGDGIYTTLSGIMHGYESSNVDISDIYAQLFSYRFSSTYIISVIDVLEIDCSTIDILDSEEFPLLAETLRQTLIYYYLRMKVEKELVDIFNIPVNHTHPPMLNQIIQRTLSYKPTDADAIRKRDYKVFFTSRKTLLNEFNHFEGNMNIFQPAIDIEPTALQNEVSAIEEKLVRLRSDYTINT
jgi:ABC-type arginine transport system ATPase subunit